MLWLALTANTPPTPHARTPETAAVPAQQSGSPDWHACACWAGRYTPRVVLAGLDQPNATMAEPALQLEIAPSLRLFGGLDALLSQIRADLQALPWRFTLAGAHTARAAYWLARAGCAHVCSDATQTRSALAALPLASLPVSADVARALQVFGLRNLGEVLALPRAALAQRLGRDFVLDLARALGEVEEPVRWFVFPEHFDHAIELPAPVDSAPVLLFAARRLVASLRGWLDARQAAVRELHWQIDHGHGELTSLPLRFSTPVWQPARIERVLQQALERLCLRRPALSLRLQVLASERRDAATQALFHGGAEQGLPGELADLLDRLRARLGDAALQTLTVHADHRPERATRQETEVANKGLAKVSRCETALNLPPRPLLLLDQPQPIAERGGRPWLGGPLTLLTGPERIESGWWDGGDARRDYFVAQDARQCWLWIYRQQAQPMGWYLHGRFA